MAKKAAKPADVWGFAFEALPGDVPARIRVRRLLKTALRRDGLKCVGYNPGELRELPADLDPEARTAGEESCAVPGALDAAKGHRFPG